MEEVGLHIALQAFFCVLERFEACFASCIGQQFATRLHECFVASYFEVNGIVFHC